jgi:hypothetical protein
MSLKWILFNVSTFFGLIFSAYLQSKRDKNGRRRGLFHPRFKELRDNKPSGGHKGGNSQSIPFALFWREE